MVSIMVSKTTGEGSNPSTPAKYYAQSLYCVFFVASNSLNTLIILFKKLQIIKKGYVYG